MMKKTVFLQAGVVWFVNQSFKIISHDMTAARWHCLFCMLWTLVFAVRIHCLHFPQKLS